jgi:hypothetical protein
MEKDKEINAKLISSNDEYNLIGKLNLIGFLEGVTTDSILLGKIFTKTDYLNSLGQSIDNVISLPISGKCTFAIRYDESKKYLTFIFRKFTLTNLSKYILYVDNKFIRQLQTKALKHKSMIIVGKQVLYFIMSKELTLDIYRKQLEKLTTGGHSGVKKKKSKNIILKATKDNYSFQIPEFKIQSTASTENILDDLIIEKNKFN